MINNEAILENTFPDPIKSLRILRTCCYVIGGIQIFLMLVASSLTVVWVGYLVAILLTWRWADRKIYEHEEDDRQYYKERKLDLEMPKLHPHEVQLEQEDRSRPKNQRKGKWWRQPGPSFSWRQTEEVSILPDGEERRISHWRRVLDGQHRSLYQKMGKWLRDTYPDVYAEVTSWWESEHANFIAGQLRPGSTYQDLEEDVQRLVRSRSEVELFQGIFIALTPQTWNERPDRRPTHRSFATLRRLLVRRIVAEKRPDPDLIERECPWHERMRYHEVYLGEGFLFQPRHTQKLYYKGFFDADKYQRWFKSEYERTQRDPGCHWYLGVGWRETGPVWTHYDHDMAQHSVFAGGSGFGKTRAVESPIVRAVLNGSSVIWLDPKIDNRMVGLIAHHSHLAGRESQVVFLCVSRPELPCNSSFNPFAGINDPAKIGNILASMLPEDGGQNQYFIDEATNSGRIAGSMVFWLNRWLTLLSGGDQYCNHPPRLLLWLEWCRLRGLTDDGEDFKAQKRRDDVATAKQAFADVYQRLIEQDRAFVPTNAHEKVLFLMWTTQEYTALYWNLSFQHLNEYVLNNRQRLASWVMRLVYTYVCAEDERFSDPFFPRTDTLEMVSGVVSVRAAAMAAKSDEKPKPSLLTLYEKSGLHLFEPDAFVGASRKRLVWSYLYEQEVDPSLLGQLQHQIVRIKRVWSEVMGQAKRDPDEYGNAVTNLRAPINEIVAGEKYDLLCAPDPDITWDRIVKEKLVVILALGSMSDQKASDAVSKALTQSLLAYAGYVQDHGGADLDIAFFGDEQFSWITKDWAHIIDKTRSTGVRTVGLCQSEAGMRYAVKNPDLYKHIITSVKNRYTVATQSKEDAESMTDAIQKTIIYRPQRSVNEQPAFGDGGNKQVKDWSSGETWTWAPEEKELLDTTWLNQLPRGVLIRRVQKQVHVFKAPYLHAAPESYLSLLGMDEKNNRSLLPGIDFSVERNEDHKRLATWGRDERLGLAAKTDAMVSIDGGDLADGEKVECSADGHRGLRLTIDDLMQGSTDEDKDEIKSALSKLPDQTIVEGDDGGMVPMPDDGICQEMDGFDHLHIGHRDEFDQRQGFWKVLDENNAIIEEGEYVDGYKEREWVVYESGKQRHEMYMQGRLVSAEEIDPAHVVNGRELLARMRKPVQSTAEEPAFDDGQASSGDVEEGLPDGTYWRGNRKDGIRRGTWCRKWRATGNFCDVHHYRDNGSPIAIWERYDADGMLVESYKPIV